MPTLRKDLRSQLETTILAARSVAEVGGREALQALGVHEGKAPAHLKPTDTILRNRLRACGRQAGDVRDERTGQQTLEQLVGVVAYEHWHRMLFARFLAENGLLLEPGGVSVSLADVAELARDAKVNVWELAGRFAQRMLPAVFRADDPVLSLILAPEHQKELEKLVAGLPPEMFLAEDSLGWTYQFWQAHRKQEVNDSGNKIGADELPAVTQLFTEDYMVDFLLDNTLGAWWAGKMAKDEGRRMNYETEEEARAAVALPGCPWKYLRFIKVQPDGTAADPTSSFIIHPSSFPTWTPAAGTFDGWPKSAKELKCLDPCMGSGHFVVAMFERLVALRMAEEKLDEPAAVAAVIRDNLFGLELDPRCTQIAAFNLALAAWRRVGHCALPAMNLACSGLAPNAEVADWLAIAGDNEKLRNGMERLYRLFQKAAVLGSLINPRAGEGDLLVAAFHELQPLLEKALAQEAKDDTTHEMAVTARGLAKAAEILAGQFTLVATNVPYLGFGKQDEVLQEFCSNFHPDAKADLATCFLERCLDACSSNGVMACVTPQNWLFLNDYKGIRKKLLNQNQWLFALRLGAGAFETITGEVVKASLVAIGKAAPGKEGAFFAADVSGSVTIAEKKRWLEIGNLNRLPQSDQLKNPNWVVTSESLTHGRLLQKFATAYEGAKTVDIERFRHLFWELAKIHEREWWFHNSSPTGEGLISGCHYVSANRSPGSAFQRNIEVYEEDGRKVVAWLCGSPCWKKMGVAVAWMNHLPASLYVGTVFDNSAAVIIPESDEHLPAIYCFIASGEYTLEVRKINQKVQVAAGTLDQVPFDLAYWQKVAAEKYPHGLPKPFSSDPTQWLFNGHPAGADQPLQVAVARLLGYQWPRQSGSSFPDCPALGSDGLEEHADEDGIVCLSPVRDERAAADRLRTLLSAALHGRAGVPPAVLGGQDARPPFDEHALIAATGGKARTLEDWLRDEMFEQHSKLFHHRPFIWHIWDGRSDGFHALVNAHKLAAPNGGGRKLLETLAFGYLGDWLRKQQDEAKRNVPGAEDRMIAAQSLQRELEAILAGEPPYDLFIRWKPLHEQPIGWEPDLNDGVRMNIRPFLLAKDVGRRGAGILRYRPSSIKWEKDRGKEPVRTKEEFPWFWGWEETTVDFAGGADFDGNRWNDCHYTTKAKRAAREAKPNKIT
jgi:hypothetical protein